MTDMSTQSSSDPLNKSKSMQKQELLQTVRKYLELDGHHVKSGGAGQDGGIGSKKACKGGAAGPKVQRMPR